MIENWFPYNIGVFYNKDHSKIEEGLVKRCIDIKNKYPDRGGDSWLSNVYNTSTNSYNLIEDKEFDQLICWINKRVYDYCTILRMSLDGDVYIPNVDGGWFNFYKNGDFQEYHSHPSIISVIYYLKSSSCGARTVFKSKAYDTFNVSYGSDLRTVGRVFYNPEPGKLLIFRGFYDHSVEQKTNDDLRITISLNYK